MILAAVIVGIVLIAFQLATIARSVQAVHQSTERLTEVVAKASDKALKPAPYFVTALVAIADALNAPRCEVPGCQRRAEREVTVSVLMEPDEHHHVCSIHDTYGDREGEVYRHSLPKPRDVSGMALPFEEYRASL